MINTANTSEVNRLEDSMSEDLDPNWNEPATRGDLRLLAMRIDTKFDLLRGESSKLLTGSRKKRLEHYLSEDLDPNWNEPATRDDLLRIVKRDETKPDQFFGEFRRSMNFVWIALAYVTIVTCLGTAWIVTTLSR
jgi:hypothetical protein